MKKLNNLTVYLSKSLLIPESRLRPIREYLIGLGLNVTEYKEGTTYSDKLLREADFVLFVINDKPHIYSSAHSIFSSLVGKGQFYEAELVYKLQKHAFIYHEIDKDNVLRVSKFTNDEWINRKPAIYDTTNWKRDYAVIYSYYKGVKLVNLENFVEGAFYSKIHNAKLPVSGHIYYPLTPEEAFPNNYQLLLLLS